MPKVCNTCSQTLSEDSFHNNSAMCKQCKKQWSRSTPERWLGTRYSLLKTRSKQTPHKTLGWASKQEFISWAMLDKGFLALFCTYKLAAWQKKFRPELDRVNPDKGYCQENCQWLTSRLHKQKSVPEGNLANSLPCSLFTITGVHIISCPSLLGAAKHLGAPVSNVHKAYEGTIAACGGAIIMPLGKTPSVERLGRCNYTKKAQQLIQGLLELDSTD